MCRWLLLMLQTEASCFYCQAWGHISRRTGHAKRPDATCLGFVNLWEILGSSQHEPRQAVCMEKALELAWWPTSWVEQNLRNHHGRAKNDSHIDGDSDLMPPPAGSVWGGLGGQRWPVSSAIIPYVIVTFEMLHQPWHLSSCCPSVGAQRKWVWVSSFMGPLRRMPGTPEPSTSLGHNPYWFLLEVKPIGFAKIYGGFLSGTRTLG